MRTVTDDHIPGFTAASPPLPGFLPWKPPPPNNVLPGPSECVQDATILPEQSLLDPDEIPEHHPANGLPPPAEPSESLGSSFRHSGWKETRSRVYRAMLTLNLPAARLRRFAECGNGAWIEAGSPIDHCPGTDGMPSPTRHRVRCNTCRDRFCSPCAGTRARLVARTLISLLDGQPARFITLTRKHTDAPLRQQIDALYDAYKRLRKTLMWQRGCYAAAAMLEIKRSRDDRTWHPHLHVLAKGKYIPHAQLKEEWHRITQDSFVVDIRFVRDNAKAASYVSKYVTKSMVEQYSTDADALAEAIAAMHHRRTVLLTGEWKRLPLEKPTDDCLWQYVGTLETIVNRALAGDHDAEEILSGLRSDHRWHRTETARSP